MKVGVKLWSTNPSEQFEKSGFADFIEVMPVTLKTVEKLAGKAAEYTIHVPHESFGFNPILDAAKSKKLLQRAVAAAKLLNAKLLVMHPGYFRHKPTKSEVSKGIAVVARLAKSNSYGKILIENMVPGEVCPEDKGRRYICYGPDELKEMLDASGAGFCLDLEHAAFTAHELGIDYAKHVNSLMKLKPDYFHLSGARFSPHGHHISILEGDVDLGFVKKLLQKAGKPVCLETPLDLEQRKKEVNLLKK